MTDLDPKESAARDLLVQAAHMGLVTALILGKNPQGEIAILGTEDLHDFPAIREMLAAVLAQVDLAILEQARPELDQKPN
jgi:hypothetical protein